MNINLSDLKDKAVATAKEKVADKATDMINKIDKSGKAANLVKEYGTAENLSAAKDIIGNAPGIASNLASQGKEKAIEMINNEKRFFKRCWRALWIVALAALVLPICLGLAWWAVLLIFIAAIIITPVVEVLMVKAHYLRYQQQLMQVLSVGSARELFRLIVKLRKQKK